MYTTMNTEPLLQHNFVIRRFVCKQEIKVFVCECSHLFYSNDGLVGFQQLLLSYAFHCTCIAIVAQFMLMFVQGMVQLLLYNGRFSVFFFVSMHASSQTSSLVVEKSYDPNVKHQNENQLSCCVVSL